MKYEEKLLKDTMTDIELLIDKINLIKHDTSVPINDCKTEREYSRVLYDLHHRLETVKTEVYRNFFVGEKRVKILKLEKFVEERLDFIQGKKRTALKADASAIYKMFEQIYDNYLRLYERICYLNRYMHESERTILGNVGESIILKINEKTGIISSIKVSEGLNFGRFMELLERNWGNTSNEDSTNMIVISKSIERSKDIIRQLKGKDMIEEQQYCLCVGDIANSNSKLKGVKSDVLIIDEEYYKQCNSKALQNYILPALKNISNCFIYEENSSCILDNIEIIDLLNVDVEDDRVKVKIIYRGRIRTVVNKNIKSVVKELHELISNGTYEGNYIVKCKQSIILGREIALIDELYTMNNFKIINY